MKLHSHVPASVVAVLSMPPGEFPIFAADASPEAAIAAHRERQAALMDASQAILARADAEGRDMTNAERAEVEGLTAEFDEFLNYDNGLEIPNIGTRRCVYDE